MSAQQRGIIGAAVYTLTTFLHALGLFLLITTKFNDENSIQKLYFIVLSFSEFVICFLGVVAWIIEGAEVMDLARTFFGYTLMYEVMIALTLDRFLKIFLNIKYPLYWKYSRTVKLMISLLAMNSIVFVIFASVNSSFEMLKTLNTYYFVPFDVIFLIVAVGTYSYILFMIRMKGKTHHFKPSETTQNSFQTIQSSFQTTQNIENSTTANTTTRREQRKKLLKRNRQFLSTFLLVITFSSFTVMPDFVYFYYGMKDAALYKGWMAVALSLMYSTSYVCDFFIYTFSSKPIRRKLLKWMGLDRNIR